VRITASCWSELLRGRLTDRAAPAQAINKDNSDQLVTVAKVRRAARAVRPRRGWIVAVPTPSLALLQNLQRFKETTAASLDAALALAQSMEGARARVCVSPGCAALRRLPACSLLPA